MLFGRELLGPEQRDREGALSFEAICWGGGNWEKEMIFNLRLLSQDKLGFLNMFISKNFIQLSKFSSKTIAPFPISY